MRTKKEIKDNAGQDVASDYATCLEVLLDIREIADATMKIVGVFVTGNVNLESARAKAEVAFQLKVLEFMTAIEKHTAKVASTKG